MWNIYLQASEVEDFLDQILQTEFDLFVEDGSLGSVKDPKW